MGAMPKNHGAGRCELEKQMSSLNINTGDGEKKKTPKIKCNKKITGFVKQVSGSKIWEQTIIYTNSAGETLEETNITFKKPIKHTLGKCVLRNKERLDELVRKDEEVCQLLKKEVLPDQSPPCAHVPWLRTEERK